MKVICWMKFESLFLGDMCNQNKTCHVLVKACCNHRHVNFPFRRLASTWTFPVRPGSIRPRCSWKPAGSTRTASWDLEKEGWNWPLTWSPLSQQEFHIISGFYIRRYNDTNNNFGINFWMGLALKYSSYSFLTIIQNVDSFRSMPLDKKWSRLAPSTGHGCCTAIPWLARNSRQIYPLVNSHGKAPSPRSSLALKLLSYSLVPSLYRALKNHCLGI